MASADRSQAAASTSTSQNFVPTLRPPATGARGILKRRAVNIPSSQEKLLENDVAWLDSSGHPGQGFRPMPDELLKRLQKASQKRQQGPSTPSKKPSLSQETSIEETSIRETSVAAKNVRTDAEAPDAQNTTPPKKPATPEETAKSQTAPPSAQTTTASKQPSPLTPTAKSTRTPGTAASCAEDAVPNSEDPLPGSAAKDKQPAQEPAPVKPTLQSTSPALAQQIEPAVAEATTTTTTTTAATEQVVVQTVEDEQGPEEDKQQPDNPPHSPDWPDQLHSEEDSDENDSEGHDEDNEFVDGDDYAQVQEDEQLFAPQEADAQQQEERQRQEGQEGQSQGLPASSPHPAFDPRRFPKANIAYSSSPSAIEVEVPDALVERRSSVLIRDRQAVFSRSMQHAPSSSPPPPGTPVAMLRRTDLQSSSRANVANVEVPLASKTKIANEKSRVIQNSPKSSRPVTSVNSAAQQEAAQPRKRLMKAPVFPTSTRSLLRTRPSMADLQMESRNSSRRSSVTGGVSTRDPSTSPPGTPASARVRVSPRVNDFDDISRREISIPTEAARPAVSASNPSEEAPESPLRGPRSLEESRDAPPPSSSLVAAAIASTPAESKDAPATQSSAARTWMLPFDAFVVAYPNYKGDLEDFLRACYSLQHTNPGALPSFLFDDIVHAFLDYIEYVHATASAGATPPQNLTQWYNLHATELVCKKSVVTRENVASILRAYPEEVRAIAHNTSAPGKEVEAVVEKATVEAATTTRTTSAMPAVAASYPAHVLSTQEDQDQPEQQEQPTPYHSFLPGRLFPHEENPHTSSQENSSGPPNSILQILKEFRGSNSTDESGQRHGPGHAESPLPHGLLGGDYNDGDTSLGHSLSQGLSSQDQGLGYTQDGSQAPLGQTRRLFEATHSSWLEDYDNEQLDLPSSPVASELVPPGMDKRFYMMQSPQLTRPQLPSTQDLVGHEELIEETPARHAISQKRSRQTFDSSRSIHTANEPVTSSEKGVQPADIVSRNQSSRQNARQNAMIDVDAVDNSGVVDIITIEETVEVDAVDNGQAGEEEVTELHDTTIMRVQSAVEPRRQLSPSPPPTKRSAALQQERRRVTIAAPDIGMVARLAAAEEVERTAPKRKLPPSMAGIARPVVSTEVDVPVAALAQEATKSATEEPPKKKKKKNRQSMGSDLALSASEKFRKFLERKLAGGASGKT
ncbi:hypothetical protein SBRCBS47491_009598 [Sporothrix bragantina]|uniref:Uncharacterized protein n=1 Tax=Sporothrix bragantina TaxID=671064 RepID=A0ABP0CW05_9PEZI